MFSFEIIVNLKPLPPTCFLLLLLLLLNCVLLVLQYMISHPTDFCQLPPDEGHGSNFKFAVNYDSTKDQCTPFIYKGEGGNANHFENERECMRNCSPNAENIYPMDGKI
uniref:BPTI/Kunitz inhibitor domain-containing protein n=1 Tax=Amphilophus citrinellus TaxID=61819 RepID=A0A3Q0QZF3_AMPCI